MRGRTRSADTRPGKRRSRWREMHRTSFGSLRPDLDRCWNRVHSPCAMTLRAVIPALAGIISLAAVRGGMPSPVRVDVSLADEPGATGAPPEWTESQSEIPDNACGQTPLRSPSCCGIIASQDGGLIEADIRFAVRLNSWNLITSQTMRSPPNTLATSRILRGNHNGRQQAPRARFRAQPDRKAVRQGRGDAHGRPQRGNRVRWFHRLARAGRRAQHRWPAEGPRGGNLRSRIIGQDHADS